MNQRLKATQDILTSLEKDTELSFKVFSKILVKQKLTLYNVDKVADKYEGIDTIFKGVTIFNSLGNQIKDYIYKRNFYKTPTTFIQRRLKGWRWANVPNGDFYTIFQVKNGEEFIKSIFLHIDNLKKNETDIFSGSIQKREVNKILQKSKEQYGKESFTFEIPLKKYFTDKICYYQIIRENPNLTIRNISIFEGIIRLSITINNSEPIKNKEIKWREEGRYLYMNYGKKEKKFTKGKNTYFIVKESLERGLNEDIDFVEMIDKLIGRKDQDKMKMVYNAVNYANNIIAAELEIEGFFGVEEKAYKRQLEVVNL